VLSNANSMWEALLKWDKDTFIFLNNLGSESYDAFWSTATNITTWIPLFLLFFILVWLKYPKKQAFWITVVITALIFFVVGCTNMTKELVARLRPNNDPEVNSMIRILKNPVSYSFFSGHSSTSFAVTTIIVLFLRKHFRWIWIFYCWPLIFVYSRIYVGVHYPIDIFVGSLVGVATAFLFYFGYKKFIVPYLKLNHL